MEGRQAVGLVDAGRLAGYRTGCLAAGITYPTQREDYTQNPGMGIATLADGWDPCILMRLRNRKQRMGQ